MPSIYGIAFLLILISCDINKNRTALTIEHPIIIDLNEAIRNKIDYKLSDIIDSITYIAVESIIDNYITYLNANMLKISDKYIISENFAGGGDLVLFDRNGRFIRKIANRGQGPDEYNWINDIAIDEKNEIIYVLSLNKLFKYNLEGVFKGIIDLTGVTDFVNRAHKIVINPSGQILVNFGNQTGDLQYRCLLLDQNGNIINVLKNYLFYTLDPNITARYPQGTYYIYNDQIHIKNICDTLFVLENNRFHPKYIFKSTENQSNNITHLEFEEKINQFGFGNVFETNSKVIFRFCLNKKWYDGYYDKNKGKAYSSASEINSNASIINNMDGNNKFSFLFTDYQYNDIIIKCRSPEFIDKDVLKETLSHSKYIEIINMLDSLKSADEDPVMLSIFYLKK